MSAHALLAGALRARGRTRAGDDVSPVLAFDAPGGPVVAVCGLHGGAGTTTLAALLASGAARASAPGRVLAVEADARAGELGPRLGACARHGLSALARRRAAGAEADGAAVVQRPDGLRVLAAAASPEPDAPPDAVVALLAEARAAHGLCVLDASSLRSSSAAAVLAAADVVVWTAGCERVDASAFASPLMRPARAARWVLALLLDDGNARPSAVLRRALRDDVVAVLVVPHGADRDNERAGAAIERLARVVRGAW